MWGREVEGEGDGLEEEGTLMMEFNNNKLKMFIVDLVMGFMSFLRILCCFKNKT